MEWSEHNHDLSRGGFQNRDVGKSNFRKDFGNDFGVDFARFANPPDLEKDDFLVQNIVELLNDHFRLKPLDTFVRNGFVFMKFQGLNQGMCNAISESVSKLDGVENVLITNLRDNMNNPSNFEPIEETESDSWKGSKNFKEARSYQGREFELDGIEYGKPEANLITKIQKKMRQFIERIMLMKK